MTELEQFLALVSIIIPPVLTYLLAIAKKNPTIKKLSYGYNEVKGLIDELDQANQDGTISQDEYDRLMIRTRKIINHVVSHVESK